MLYHQTSSSNLVLAPIYVVATILGQLQFQAKSGTFCSVKKHWVTHKKQNRNKSEVDKSFEVGNHHALPKINHIPKILGLEILKARHFRASYGFSCFPNLDFELCCYRNPQ